MAVSAVMLLSSGCAAEKKEIDDSADHVSARVTVSGTSFMVDGKELWLSGVNTPWHHWNDFTGKMDEQFWENTFAQLSQDNINSTRIWINCNGESIVKLNPAGDVREINEGHWTDLEKLFDIADKYGVYVMPTITSFDHFKDENGNNKSAQKWQKLIQSSENVDIFAEKYVAEFCRRFGDREYIFAIDLMNEPDWVYENGECGKIDWEYLSYFFGRCAQTVHENSELLVTVGTGMIKYNSDEYSGNMVSDKYLQELAGSDKAYLDFYSPHYYMWERSFYGFPFDKSPTEFGLDGTKPAIIAETSNDDEKQCGMNLSEKYKAMYDNGWNGLMVWMEPKPDEEKKWYCYDLTQNATNYMAEQIADKIYPIGKKKLPAGEAE